MTADIHARIEAVHPFLGDERTLVDDQLVNEARCVVHPSGFKYVCQLVRVGGDGHPELRTYEFCRNEVDASETDSRMLYSVHCTRDSDRRYECLEPVAEMGATSYPPDIAGWESTGYPRVGPELVDGWDWQLAVDWVDADVVGVCIADLFLDSVLDSAVRRAMPEINDSVLAQARDMFGSSFVSDFGIPVDDLPTCGRLPNGALNHLDCDDAYFIGRMD